MIFDIEANSLFPTKIHCLVYSDENEDDYHEITDYDEMVKFLEGSELLIGHNIIRYDIPSLERILGIKIKAKLIDTLALSWYLEPKRARHGLEWWGEDFGIPKPPIYDWDGLPVEKYIHRCIEDVKINKKVWKRFDKHLNELYEDNIEDKERLIEYLTFKMDCAAAQEESGWLLDREKAEKLNEELVKGVEEKFEKLTKVMPKVPVYATREKPKHPYKKDGTKSEAGKRWFQLLKEEKLPKTHEEPVKVITHYVEPNPGSHGQVKNWLFSLGWEPQTFKVKRDKDTGDIKKIPQIYEENTEEVCQSVKKLFDKVPELEDLNSLSVLKHRAALLSGPSGFLNKVNSENYVEAQISGLTNTLRFKHRVVVNLPGVHTSYGKELRSCLIAEEGYELCGSDMKSLEDRTKQHYMYEYDPEYVEEMNVEGWDAHLDIAIVAGMLTEKQVELHKNGKEPQDKIRHAAKQGNYACTYGAGAPRVAFTASIPLHDAERLVKAYWKRNWSIKAVAESCEVKTVKGQKWLFNPVSRFWYSLRYEKDRFSTLNQGTADYCFNVWLKYIRSRRRQLTAQFHDEVVLNLKKGFRERCSKLLIWAIDKTNEELNLNRKLDIDIKYGDNYAEIH